MPESVLVGMSGGVDSAVAAAILVRSGYRVTGVTLRLWTENHPFDPTNYQAAKINFETDRDALKTIYIFDVRGREVARLVDSDDSLAGVSLKGIGSGSILWDGKLKDGSYAAVGIYIVCLEVKSGANTRRATALVSVGKER